MEGRSVEISCGSDCGPEGRAVLRRASDGQEAELQSSPGCSTSLTYTLLSVHLTHSGLYTCEASNQQGSEADSVWVQVHAPPRNTTVTALPSWQVQEGQNVTVSWQTVSFPPASAVLRKESGGGELHSQDGTFRLLHLTPADDGLYQLNVSNPLGYHTELLTLSVTSGRRTSPPEESRMLPKVLIPALGLGAMVTAAAVVIRYLRKVKGREARELAKDAVCRWRRRATGPPASPTDFTQGLPVAEGLFHRPRTALCDAGGAWKTGMAVGGTQGPCR
ncbi:hypothetical protein AAFF_G00222020 [Aldrovandia affinis]|uniref:Ig-like domain-containing protein n=1 Tax=Aldrovandia affinis TaxID=143900 RepID=A0AAD7RFX8_9TELE|nr:hypothetical protein AAFF_G00222020 [Aldrovandia affinis]